MGGLPVSRQALTVKRHTILVAGRGSSVVGFGMLICMLNFSRWLLVVGWMPVLFAHPTTDHIPPTIKHPNTDHWPQTTVLG
jgi:hypothetical protein